MIVPTVSGYAGGSGAGVVPPTWSAPAVASGRGPGGQNHQWPATRRPTLTCEPPSAPPPPVRGSEGVLEGVEIMLITEQDKFPGMTRGLAKPGGRQSRGDSWVGVLPSRPHMHLLFYCSPIRKPFQSFRFGIRGLQVRPCT